MNLYLFKSHEDKLSEQGTYSLEILHKSEEIMNKETKKIPGGLKIRQPASKASADRSDNLYRLLKQNRQYMSMDNIMNLLEDLPQTIAVKEQEAPDEESGNYDFSVNSIAQTNYVEDFNLTARNQNSAENLGLEQSSNFSQT